MMYDQIPERPKWVYHSDEEIELIHKGYQSNDPKAKEISYQLIDKFLRWGDAAKFKDLN